MECPAVALESALLKYRADLAHRKRMDRHRQRHTMVDRTADS